MRISLIIAAGGSGSRFKAGDSQRAAGRSKKPATKLFYPLGGIPLLLRTLLSFQAVPEVKETIIALPSGVEREVKSWIRSHHLRHVICVRGGKTRADSVQRALRRSSTRQPWVMIHDGARPFVKAAVVRDLVRHAQKKSWDACLIAKKVVPTIKQTRLGETQVERTLDRSRLYEAETPQLFRRTSLLRAYQMLPTFKEAPTDEAALMEAADYCVHLWPSELWNPKITTVSDFELAESFIRSHEGMINRVGFGSDTHRLL
ncbi:MAG: 2-C-methyl-D-erythritol 4-phosphate cytidylyltransferase, partial [Candidatus Omnitrophica bacterium]|nr:2-C-methyl-D-erythritol 4-phosphate cytidylyltransferase [Candidatus Omnitrophota bacterium]